LAERRLAVLETAVASSTAEKNRDEHIDEPRGKFAHIGGIERHPARSFETPEKRSDFLHIGGRKVGQHTAPPEESESVNH